MVKFKKYYLSIFSFICLISIWQILGFLSLLPKYILPTPIQIVSVYFNDFHDLFLVHTAISLYEAIIGLTISIILAFILAILIDSFDFINKLLYPYIIISQTIPTIAIAPLLVLFFGYGLLPKIILIVINTCFPLLISIIEGFKDCDDKYLKLFKLMNATKIQTYIHLKIPYALSYFYSGLKLSVSYAFISAVVAEWLGSFNGLGAYMIRAKKAFEYDKMFAIIVLISLISLISVLLVKLSEKKLIKWKYLGGINEKNN